MGRLSSSRCGGMDDWMDRWVEEHWTEIGVGIFLINGHYQ